MASRQGWPARLDDVLAQLALTVEMPDENLVVHLIANAYWEALEFQAFHGGAGSNTGLDAPQDIVHWEAAPPAPSCAVRAEPRSVIVFFAEVLSGASALPRDTGPAP